MEQRRRLQSVGRFALHGLPLSLCLAACGPPATKPVETNPVRQRPSPAAGRTITLFDGKTLKGWEIAAKDFFQGRGKVSVKDGSIVMETGASFTGVTWTGACPRENYEITFEAQRLVGVDIFCGLTAPVGDAHVTLVLGGWGDTLVGLSNIDGRNASDNESTHVMGFENEAWYGIRWRVTRQRIEAWIDGAQVVDVERVGRKFDIYEQLMPLRPLGIFTWETEGAVRDIQLMRLDPE